MHSPISQRNELLDTALLTWTQDFAPHGVFVTDSDLNVRFWNQWLQTQSGMSANVIIGRPLFELFPGMKQRRIDEQFKRALKGESTVLSSALHNYLLPLPSPIIGGPFKHMRQTARIGPLWMDGKVCGTIATIEDVTEREFQASQTRHQQSRDKLLSWALAQLLQSENPEQFLSELYERTRQHLDVEYFFAFLTEPTGSQLKLHAHDGLNERQASRAASLEFGSDLCGRNTPEQKAVSGEPVGDSDTSELAFLRELRIQGYIEQPMCVGSNLIGMLIFASTRRQRFSDDETDLVGTIGQYVAMAIDRSRKEKALVAAGAKLEGYAQELERKVEERTAKLTETVADLEGFCYTVSHDLRAPIRHIASYLQAFREEGPKNLTVEAVNFLERIQSSASRMDLLTRDLLRYSKVSREQIRMEPVDVAAIVGDIIDHSPNLQAPGVVTLAKDIPRVIAQRSLLQQCLVNLLENAIKFIPEGTNPKISIYAEMTNSRGNPRADSDKLIFNRPGNVPPNHHEAEHGERHSAPALSGKQAQVRIWIEDNGIGIAPAFAEKIFGLFERACDPHCFQGTGIGLAIVAKGMQRMGGHCGVESELGKGSRFWLELPRAD